MGASHERGPTTTWRGLIAATAVAIAVAACWSDASAQQKTQGPPNALQGFRNSRRAGKNRAAALRSARRQAGDFTGDVHVLQGDTEMRCKLLTVFYEEETGDAQRQGGEPGPAATSNPPDRGQRQRGGGPEGSKRGRGCCNLQHAREHRHAHRQRRGHAGGILRGPRLGVDLATGVAKMDQGGVEGLFQSGPRNAPPDPRNAPEKK